MQKQLFFTLAATFSIVSFIVPGAAADSPPVPAPVSSSAASSSAPAAAAGSSSESEYLPNDEDVIDPEAGMLGDEYMGDPGELEVED